MKVLEKVEYVHFNERSPNIHLVMEESPSYTKHDLLFKQLIRYCFNDFMEAFFPDIYEQIDLESISFTSGEVFTDVVKGSSRRLDMVIETRVKDTEAVDRSVFVAPAFQAAVELIEPDVEQIAEQRQPARPVQRRYRLEMRVYD